MRKILLFALATLLMFSSSCNEDTVLNPAEQQDVSGILQTNSGEMLVGALVLAQRDGVELARDTTDDYGAFMLKALPQNVDNVNMMINHFSFDNVSVELKNYKDKFGADKVVPFVLQNDDSCCGTVILTIKDKVTGQVIGNAHVKISRGNTAIKSKMSDASGFAEFTNLCEGEYWFRVFREGYKVVEENFVITNCDPKNFTVLLQKKEDVLPDSCCNGVFKLFLRDSVSNQGLVNKSVKIYKGGAVLADGKTNGDGYIKFEKLCPGDYAGVYFVNEVGYEFHFAFECNDTLTVTKLVAVKEPCCDGKIIVNLKDLDNQQNLDSAKVRVWKNGTMLKYQFTANGKAVFNDMCAGQYAIDILKEGYKSIEFSFGLECPGTAEFNKTLAREAVADTCCKGKVKVWVRDSVTNQGIPNVVVKLTQGSKVIKDGKTNGDGYIYFENVCDGDYAARINLSDGTTKGAEFTLTCNQAKVIELYAKIFEDSPCTTGKLKLRIKNETDSTYINLAEVIMYANGQAYKTAVSGVEGWAVIEGITAPATYTVKVKKAGFKTKEFTIQFTECNTKQETIMLETE